MRVWYKEMANYINIKFGFKSTKRSLKFSVIFVFKFIFSELCTQQSKQHNNLLITIKYIMSEGYYKTKWLPT